MNLSLRLRVDNQLGFKMVKWIRAIEFVESPGSVGQGEGGYKEDQERKGDILLYGGVCAALRVACRDASNSTSLGRRIL